MKWEFSVQLCLEINSPVPVISSAEPNDNLTVQNHELRLHEINTLEWDELVVANDSNNSNVTSPGNMPFTG